MPPVCTVGLPGRYLSFGDPDPAASSETNLQHTRPQLHLLEYWPPWDSYHDVGYHSID